MELVEASVRTELKFEENAANITHLRHMLAHVLEMEDMAGLSVGEKRNVKASVRALKAAISSLESQLFA